MSDGGGWRRALLGAAAGCVGLVIGLLSLAPEAVSLLYVARPLATLLLLVLAATTREPLSPSYRALVTAGLAATLVGDVLLMVPADRFLAGRLAFLVAHGCLLAAFASRAPLLRHRLGVIAYAAVATVVLALVLPAVGGALRFVLVTSVVVLALMAAQAVSWMLEEPASSAARFGAIGAACLVASDALLALDRFVLVIPARDLLVLLPFWLGLALLALSVRRPPPPALRL